MLGPLLRRKLYRDLSVNRTKVLVSLVIVALGVSGYFSYTQETRNLEASYRATYSELDLADHWVELALPAPEATFDLLNAQPEVTALQPRLHLFGRFSDPASATGKEPSREVLAEVLGLPPEPADLNRLRITDGAPLTADHSSVRASGQLPVVLERQVVQYHDLGLGDTFVLSLPYFDPLATFGTVNDTSDSDGNGDGNDDDQTLFQLGGGVAVAVVNVTARVVGVAVSPEYLVVTGNEAVLVPRPRSVGVFFVDLVDLQSAVNLTPLKGYERFGGFVNEAALKTPDLSQLDPLMEREGLAPLRPLIYQTQAREDQHSVKILNQDLEGFKQLTPPLSGLILAVAGFTIAMNLQRIIAGQRRQIGVLRAMGASSGQVLVYYGLFALIIGLLGSLLGLLLGALQSDYLTTAYAETLGLPEVKLLWELEVAVMSLLFGMAMALLFGLLGARQAAALQPREAMSPSHPDRASPSLARLTRGRPLAVKLALRNLARNPLRTTLTVGGLGFALILPLCLGGILASFDSAIDGMFDQPNWSGSLIFATSQPQDETLADLQDLPGVTGVVPYAKRVLLAKGQQVPTTGLPSTGLFRLRTHQGDHRFASTPAGEAPRAELVIDTIFAREHDLERGDRLTLSLQGVSRTLTIVALNVEIMAHFYVPLDYLQDWWQVADVMAHPPNGSLPDRPISGVYLSGEVLALRDPGQLPPYVVEVVEAREFEQQVSDLMDLFTFYVNLFYLIGGVMCLLIIANTATMNLLERESELATLKTLGAPSTLLGQVVALENVSLGLIAGAVGIALTFPITDYLLTKFTGELFYVPLAMPLGLGLAFYLLVVVLSLLATLPAYLRLRSFDLAGTIRSVER